MSLSPLFQWAAHAPVFAIMRDSNWAFALVEMVHLLALAAFGGAILIVDLGALGIGFRSQTPRFVRDLSTVSVASLIVMIVSGSLLISAEAMKCYYHPAFRLKMLLFAVGVVFHLTVHTHGINRPPVWSKVAALFSLLVWLGVGLAGRAIGFL